MSNEPRALSYGEIEQKAWEIVATGAESYVEDLIDEGDEFRPEDFKQIRDEAVQIISGLKHGEVRWT